MQRKEKAASLFNNGYNCAQSVAGAFEDELKAEKYTLINIAKGFGGGMGKMQETCGAVAGSVMVLSSLIEAKTTEEEEKLNQNIRNFFEQFTEHNGALSCKNLIPYNLRDEDERQKAHEEKVFEIQCTKYVETAVEIVEKILHKK